MGQDVEPIEQNTSGQPLTCRIIQEKVEAFCDDLIALATKTMDHREAVKVVKNTLERAAKEMVLPPESKPKEPYDPLKEMRRAGEYIDRRYGESLLPEGSNKNQRG